MANVIEMQKRMLAVLSAAQAERPSRGKWVTDADVDEEGPAWVFHERRTMFDAVNKERAARRLPPIELKSLLRAENLATGHSDYSAKFALYCAELALGHCWKA